MNSDQIWAAIDTERAGLADLLEGLTPQQWTAPSLCDGWMVRDVAAHLTHSHMAPLKAMIEAVKSGFRFDPMIKRLGIEDTRSQAQIVAALRAMVGSRRKVPITTDRDPLMDILVHTQDITVPLGIDRPMPMAAAVEVAHHLWRMRFPMHPAGRLAGMRLVATDADFAVGEGLEVRAPIRDVVMILAGRLQPAT
jgi:uncharacterized protein (TIGR03083 family)